MWRRAAVGRPAGHLAAVVLLLASRGALSHIPGLANIHADKIASTLKGASPDSLVRTVQGGGAGKIADALADALNSSNVQHVTAHATHALRHATPKKVAEVLKQHGHSNSTGALVGDIEDTVHDKVAGALKAVGPVLKRVGEAVNSTGAGEVQQAVTTASASDIAETAKGSGPKTLKDLKGKIAEALTGDTTGAPTEEPKDAAREAERPPRAAPTTPNPPQSDAPQTPAPVKGDDRHGAVKDGDRPHFVVINDAPSVPRKPEALTEAVPEDSGSSVSAFVASWWWLLLGFAIITTVSLRVILKRSDTRSPNLLTDIDSDMSWAPSRMQHWGSEQPAADEAAFRQF